MTEADTPDLADAHTAKLSLRGRKAIITGGTTGIGRAIAVLLASEGVDVFICGRNQPHLYDALDRIRDVGTGEGLVCDLAEASERDAFFRKAEEYFGSYDIAVINAAVPAEGVGDMDEDEVRYAVAVDFTAYVLGAHKAVSHMMEHPPVAGDIILIGSYSAHKLGPGSTVYAGCKAGVHGFAEALRREVAQDGIKVSLVVPALTGSDLQYPDMPHDEQARRIEEESMLRAEDIAVGVHYALTQPRRCVVQEIVLAQRATDA
jgi:3-oxoacyl-[acyl-carrier protein] reductase